MNMIMSQNTRTNRLKRSLSPDANGPENPGTGDDDGDNECLCITQVRLAVTDAIVPIESGKILHAVVDTSDTTLPVVEITLEDGEADEVVHGRMPPNPTGPAQYIRVRAEGEQNLRLINGGNVDGDDFLDIAAGTTAYLFSKDSSGWCLDNTRFSPSAPNAGGVTQPSVDQSITTALTPITQGIADNTALINAIVDRNSTPINFTGNAPAVDDIPEEVLALPATDSEQEDRATGLFDNFSVYYLHDGSDWTEDFRRPRLQITPAGTFANGPVSRPAGAFPIRPLTSEVAGNVPATTGINQNETFQNLANGVTGSKNSAGILVPTTELWDAGFADWYTAEVAAGRKVYVEHLDQRYRAIEGGDFSQEPNSEDYANWVKVGWYKHKYNLFDVLKLDGSNETAAARAFIESRPENSAFVVPAGKTLGLGAQLRMLNGQFVIGEGEESVIKALDGANATHLILARNPNLNNLFGVMNITLDGNRDNLANNNERNCIFAIGSRLIAKNVKAINATDVGIRVNTESSATLTDITTEFCDRGIFIDTRSTCTLYNHVASNCHNGLAVHDSTGSYQRIQSHNNTQHGVVFTHCDNGFSLSDVETNDNSETGVTLGGQSSVGLGPNNKYTATNIRSRRNGFLGMTIDPTIAGDDTFQKQDSVVSDVTVEGNVSHGLNVTHADNVLMTGIQALSNGGEGVAVANSSRVNINGLTAIGNSAYGISYFGDGSGVGNHKLRGEFLQGNTLGDIRVSTEQVVDLPSIQRTITTQTAVENTSAEATIFSQMVEVNRHSEAQGIIYGHFRNATGAVQDATIRIYANNQLMYEDEITGIISNAQNRPFKIDINFIKIGQNAQKVFGQILFGTDGEANTGNGNLSTDETNTNAVISGESTVDASVNEIDLQVRVELGSASADFGIYRELIRTEAS